MIKENVIKTVCYSPSKSPYFSTIAENKGSTKKNGPLVCPSKSFTESDGGLSNNHSLKHTLHDVIAMDLDILIIGFNPGLVSASKGHHYAGPTNHMWPCLFYSGLIPYPFLAKNETEALKYGIGFTNIVARTTRSSADITSEEMKKGALELGTKILKYGPKIAVFNGKGIYEAFAAHKKFDFGKQPTLIGSSVIYVMPSSSARCSQLPRLEDKLPFFVALRKLRDHVRGDLTGVDESEFVFKNVSLHRKPTKKI